MWRSPGFSTGASSVQHLHASTGSGYEHQQSVLSSSCRRHTPLHNYITRDCDPDQGWGPHA